MYVQTVILSFALFIGGFWGRPATSEWEGATKLADSRNDRWREIFSSLDVDPQECEAVVFPELLRYRRLQDGVEQAALMAWYIDGGTAASNFSVGLFQMKPSFVEDVERAWMQSGLQYEYELYFVDGSSRDIRRRRVSRIRDEEWQCVYVALFVRMMLQREPSLLEMTPEDRVAFLATAYNYSFNAPLDELQNQISRKNFYLDIIRLKRTPCYSYAELAKRYFREITN